MSISSILAEVPRHFNKKTGKTETWYTTGRYSTLSLLKTLKVKKILEFLRHSEF